MHVEVDRLVDADAAATRWPPASSACSATCAPRSRTGSRCWRGCTRSIAELERRPPPLPAEERGREPRVPRWLADDHFTFLGYRAHDLVDDDGEDALRLVPGAGLGMLRETARERRSAELRRAAAARRARYARATATLLVVTKSNSRSTVHRPGYLDYIGVKRFDDQRQGHAASTASSACSPRRPTARSPAEIPLLRRKVDAIVRARRPPAGRPRWQGAATTSSRPIRATSCSRSPRTSCYETALGILHLGERQRLRLFVRRDPFERFVSCLIYVPRENYTTELRLKWQAILMQAFNGTSAEFDVLLSRIGAGAHP